MAHSNGTTRDYTCEALARLESEIAMLDNPNAFASLDAEGGLWEAVDNAPPLRRTA